MKPREVLYQLQLPEQALLSLVTLPYDTPRGNRVELELRSEHCTLRVLLLEGHARQLGLALRKWVRVQKSLRGDTPRGRAKLAVPRAQEAGDAAAVR